MKAGDPPGEDDASLFFRAVDGARRIEAEQESNTLEARPAAAEKIDYAIPNDDAVFLQAMKKIGANFQGSEPEREEDEHLERRSPSSRMKQLKRGTLRISQELDLHGFLKDEALAQLEHFIRSAFNSNQQAVLVITGKGINSPEGPVLQGAVAGWLRGKGKGMVSEFSPAPRDQGGSGAFVVFLKKV